MKLNEVRKEDDLYYQGAFWIIADSIEDIYDRKFDIVGSYNECNYYGEYINRNDDKRTMPHQVLWKLIGNHYYPWNYYPRGRVCIHNGRCWINLHSSMNVPAVVNKVIKEYNLYNLDITIDCKDTYQGSHYDYLLK